MIYEQGCQFTIAVKQRHAGAKASWRKLLFAATGAEGKRKYRRELETSRFWKLLSFPPFAHFVIPLGTHKAHAAQCLGLFV